MNKDKPWRWGEAEQSAFAKLKDLITSAPILTFPDNSHMYRVEADSLDFTTGGHHLATITQG